MTFNTAAMAAASQWPAASRPRLEGDQTTYADVPQTSRNDGRDHDSLEYTETPAQDDEAPPPYEEVLRETLAMPEVVPVELSNDDGPQVSLQGQPAGPIQPPGTTGARMRSQESMSESKCPSEAVRSRNASVTGSTFSLARRPVATPSLSQSSDRFSSAKAREAGCEIDQTESPHRSASSGTVPSVRIIPPTEALTYTRQVGRATAYLVPFPKPRIKGVQPEDIPVRFLIYTPPVPPLSKPLEGEKESHWHKKQRLWQEDVRKGAMSKASKATWKGFKSSTTELIHKGINLTRSTNVEFLDRLSGGAITSSTVEHAADEHNDQVTDAPLSSEPESTATPSEELLTPSETKSSSASSANKEATINALEDITLIYPASLTLSADQIRTEFVDTLMRTREKSRNQALVASALLPIAATLDACLLVTVGGLTQVSSAWAYTNTRGTIASRRLSKGLARGEQQATAAEAAHDPEVRGCTCGHHEDDFGSPEPIPPMKDKKGKKRAIDLHLQQSTQIEILRRYLDLACLKRDYNLFPTIEEAAGDVNEGSVLEAIGWSATKRSDQDLEIEIKGRVEKMTPEQDEMWQGREARDDVKRYMRKGAAEWVNWCKAFAKDPEGNASK